MAAVPASYSRPTSGRAHGHPLDHPAVDAIREQAASSLGLRLVRDDAAYAATDGRGTLRIGARPTLDDDDCVAQLVFHELCHALVQGEGAWTAPDWGLDNTSDRDEVREYACLRLQAHLADAHGLRALMAPTTVVRPYYEGLPAQPLDDTRPETVLACEAFARAQRPPMNDVLAAALQGTASHLATHGGPSAPARVLP